MRCSLGDVLSWPAQHSDLLRAFFAKEPPPEERIELAIAQLTALAFNRTRGKGEDPRGIDDFLPDDPWAPPAPAAAPSDLDARLMSRIDSIGRKAKE